MKLINNIEESLIRSLARQYYTPLYIFQEQVIRQKCIELHNALPYKHKRIRYACKALTLGAVLRIIRDEGLWIDASSINEVHRSLRAGFLPNEIVYTGESSSREIYDELLRRNILINCTSLDQLRLLGKLKKGAECSIRINPGEGHGATNKTNTGGPSSKHGIYYDEIKEIKSIAKKLSIGIIGVHSHIGSETNLTHWLRIKDKTLEIARNFPKIRFVNLGGGLPVVYNPEVDKPMPLKEWGQKVSESMVDFSKECGKDIELHIEPGRYVVAESGSLVAEVQTIKRTPDYNFVIVNTGLNHNIRPALYGSYHPIKFISGLDKGRMSGKKSYIVAGYLCESGDVFTQNREKDEKGNEGELTLAPREFPILQVGDYMVMGNVGAYCHSMKSEYNSMNLPASIMIGANKCITVIERRGTLLDQMRRELDAYNEGR
jgi:diaminopimelate decarboxylase